MVTCMEYSANRACRVCYCYYYGTDLSVTLHFLSGTAHYGNSRTGRIRVRGRCLSDGGRKYSIRLVYPGGRAEGSYTFLPWQCREYIAPPRFNHTVPPSQAQYIHFRLSRIWEEPGKNNRGRHIHRCRSGMALSCEDEGTGAK